MDIAKKLKINVRLLPIKLHYFLFWGGIGSSVIFVPLLAKSVGISASVVGILWTVISLSTLICQPGFGAISDRFQNSRALVMIVVSITALTLYSLLYIPPIETEYVHYLAFNCNSNNFFIEPHSDYNSTCLNFALQRDEYCSFLHQERQRLSGDISSFCSSNITNMQSINSSIFSNHSHYSNCSKFQLQGCTKDILEWTSCDPLISSCFIHNEGQKVNTIYKTYQLWLFAALMIISQTMMYTCFSLSDAICYEVLGKENVQHYGKQRLWSTVSYGLASLAAGYFNDIVSEKQEVQTYVVGFYIMLGAVFLDLIVLYKMPHVKVNMAIFSFRNVGKLLVSFEIIIFAIGVFFIGMLTSIIWNYQFWFLESLGASQLLLGLTSAMQSLVANVLFFAISGKIVQTLGHFYSLIIAFLGFAIRYCLYYVLKDPWHMLPVEMLDGVTFSLFYVTITGFAKVMAPVGMEATMVGVLVATFEGLGIAAGSLLAGVGFDYLGARYTFLTAGAASTVCAVLLMLLKLASQKSNSLAPNKEEKYIPVATF